MRFLKDQPRRDRLKGNANLLLRRRVAAGMTQDRATALYRLKIGPVARRTWQAWEKKKKFSDIPPGAFLIF
jgi:hypothetical protein